MIKTKWLYGLILLLLSAAWHASEASDSGIITSITGRVLYQNDNDRKTPKEAAAFMKIREGDRMILEENAGLILIYTENGRKETWKGSAVLHIGRDRSASADSAEPAAASVLSETVISAIRQTPLPFSRMQMQRSGAAVVRSGDTYEMLSETPPISPSDREKAVHAARQRYQALKQKTTQEDFTSELYLISELIHYGLYDDAGRFIRSLSENYPAHPVLIRWQEWVQEKINAFPIAVYVYLLRKAPDCRYEPDCIDLPSLGRSRRTGPYTPEQISDQKLTSGDIITFFLKNESADDYYPYLINISDNRTVVYPVRSGGILRAGQGIDLLIRHGIGLLMETSGKEVIQVLASETPINSDNLLNNAAALPKRLEFELHIQ